MKFDNKLSKWIQQMSLFCRFFVNAFAQEEKNDNYYDEQGSDLNDGLWLVIGTGAKE